jgi:hypothetical protein
MRISQQILVVAQQERGEGLRSGKGLERLDASDHACSDNAALRENHLKASLKRVDSHLIALPKPPSSHLLATH